LTGERERLILDQVPKEADMKKIAFILLLALLGAASAGAGELRELELTDGSTVAAEVLSLANGVYTLRSDSLGTFTLQESKVRSIRSRSARQAVPESSTAGEIRGLQDRMMGDKEVMGMIQSLQNDPEFEKVLEDPALMNAVNNGDLATLLANPKFMKLLNNATVKDIQKKVQ
jgi:hypothetical protein